MTNNEKHALLAGSLTFWQDIPHELQQEILQNTSYKKFRAGESIHTPDVSCDGIYIIKKGELRAYLISSDGKEFTLSRLFPAQVCVLSASCILNSIKFDTFIDAEIDSELLLIHQSFLKRLHKEYPIIENFTLKATVEKFSEVVKTLESIYFLSIEQRLAIFLIDESERQKTEKIQITHEQIAQLISSVRETVSRVLKRWEQQGILQLYRCYIHILHFKYLHTLAENDY